MAVLSRFLAAAAAAAIQPAIVPAQPAERLLDSNALGWYAYSGDYLVGSGRWGLHLDAQWRRSGVILRWQQLSLRPAVIFAPEGRWTYMAGYAFIRTYPYGAYPDPYANPEHRSYQEALATHSANAWQIGHRIRLEQRFLGILPEPPAPEVDSWRYQNRLRYQLDAQRDLSRTLYVQLSAEPHVRFGWNYRGRAIDQMRLYSGLGRRLSEDWRAEIGYLYQLGIPRTGVVFESNHIVQITLYSDLRIFTGRR